MVSPKAIKDDEKGLATQPVGAGPFKLTNYTAPTSATLVRNPGYWDAKDIHLEGVDLKFFTDEQALLSSLLSGQVQLANIGGEQVSTAESSGFEVEEFPSLHVASIEVNVLPSHRRRGLATALYVEAERRARDAGRTTVIGEVNVPAGQTFDTSAPGGFALRPARSRPRC